MEGNNRIRNLLLPLLGTALPLAGGLVPFASLHPLSIAFVLALSSLGFYWLCQTVQALQLCLRARNNLRKNATLRLGVVLSGVLVVTVISAAASGILLQWLTVKDLNLEAVWRFTAIVGVLMLVVSLIDEVSLLNAELAVDEQVMLQLEQERLQAETSVLQNELDPHFLFNSLNALSYLVRNDTDKAYQFVHKLSNVFKYLLLNKQKDYVSLEEELNYLDDYCFLLEVRFENSVCVQKQFNRPLDGVQVVPCTLQTLVENAIKHNFFSEKDPLVISLTIDEDFITVLNCIKPKPYKPASTRTGLQNLRSRYQLIMQRKIKVKRIDDTFAVSVPFRKTAKLAAFDR